MRDRFGRMVYVAWSAKEDAYVRAIIEMGCKPEHLRELSELNGRSLRACQERMYTMRRQMRLEALAARIVRTPLPTVIMPQMRRLTKDELMQGRAHP